MDESSPKVVKDGSISGIIPRNDTFSVYYPGYPLSMANAVKSLGGTHSISKVRESPSNNLELHFRPEDPYSHPAFGRRQLCNNMLLKLSQRKTPYQNTLKDNLQDIVGSKPIVSSSESFESEKPIHKNVSEGMMSDKYGIAQVDLYASVVTRISEAYHFKGMVDYQYILSKHLETSDGRKRKCSELVYHLDSDSVMDQCPEDAMTIIPSLFSIKDVPKELILRSSGTVILRKRLEGIVHQQWEMDIEPCLGIDFNIGEIPKRVNWEEYISRESEQWAGQMAVANLFDERPVWPKKSVNGRLIENGLTFGDFMLRRFLFRVAYYFSNGPFLRFWIRKGYDPRKDSESRKYQRVEFRVPLELRNYCDAGKAGIVKPKWKNICSFSAFPYKCQISLQLFELEDDYIQEMVNKPAEKTVCMMDTGWFSYRVHDILRFCVAKRLLSVHPKANEKGIFKAASNRFERSKKVRVHKNDLRSTEDDQKRVFHEDTTSKKKEDDVDFNESDSEEDNDKDEISEEDDDKEEISEEDDDKEEISEEDDDKEEISEGPTVNDEARAIDSQSWSYGDGASRNYLFDLFGWGQSDKEDDDPNSNGEYKIFEQSSEDDDD